jgi:hypothetical protein
MESVETGFHEPHIHEYGFRQNEKLVGEFLCQGMERAQRAHSVSGEKFQPTLA